jgi:tetratricopeptide (TPR) repeat protein
MTRLPVESVDPASTPAVPPASNLTLLPPSTECWREIFALLDTALDLDPPARAQWLASLDPASAGLGPWLDELLRTHAAEETSDFMRNDAIVALDGMRAPPVAGADLVVGPYRLLREIGQGGMATVWLAERADGLLERRVAVKLPHVSWGMASFADRMARERSILGSLSHPNIARLYDAGLAADGRPYLALEYVDGQPIDAYASARGLGLRDRIGLLLQVARAVAYAHAQLVVHRDLKPSNILVDKQGRAHLLDFGVARLVDPDPDAASASPLTVTTGRPLTPDYASPEQIRGDAIGTASDVYSLGVVAFELLAGVRPYRLSPGLGVAALAEAVARVDVPLASVTTHSEALRGELRGDLDAILARALAKAGADRYASVDALGDDLERHLRGEPVRARAPSSGYVAERWVRRHKLETAIAAALIVAAAAGAYAQVLVSLALGAGALVALWQRNQARRQAAIARHALARGEQVKDFIASIFTQAVPRAGRGGVVAAADLLRAAARRVESDLAGQPAVAAELGTLIGASFNELGEMQAALEWLPKAVDLCTRELGATHRLTLQSRYRWIEAANWIGDLTISDALLPALVRDLRAARPPDPKLLAVALEDQGFVHAKHGREAESIAAMEEAVAVATSQLGEGSDNALLSRVALSNTLIHFARKSEALAAIEPALALARAAHGEHRPHRVLLVVERGQADAMASNQRPREAAVLLRQVLADQRALDSAETPRVREAMTFLGKALLLGGQLDEATEVFAQAAALHEQLTGGLNHEGAGAQTWLGRTAVMRGDSQAALACLSRADDIARSLGDEGEVQTSNRATIRILAQAHVGQDAEVLVATEALAADPAPPVGTNTMRLLQARAIALRRTGRAEEGLRTARQGLAVAGDAPALELGLTLVEMARCHLGVNDVPSAEQCWREALVAWKSGQVDGMADRLRLELDIAALRPTG